MKGLNLSKFKKVGGDKDKTIMQHADGHEMTIAHKSLSPKFRKDLMDLPVHKAEGGAVEDKGPKIDKKKAEEFSKGATKSGWQPEEWAKNIKQAVGIEEPQKMADGGPVQDIDLAQTPGPSTPAPAAPAEAAQQAPVVVNVNSGQAPQAQPAPAPAPAPDPGLLYHMGQSLANNPAIMGAKLAVQGIPKILPALSTGVQNIAAGVAGNPANTVQAEQAAAAAQPPAGMSAPAPSPAAAPAAAPGPSDPYGTQAYTDNFMKGLNEQKSGLAQSAAAADAMGKQEAAALQTGVAQQQATAKGYQDHYNELEQERKAFQADIANAHIDPNRFMNSKGVGSKITTAIGLILGGIGAGATKTENPVTKFITQQIHNDIEAQKAELGKKENLLAANMRQFGNLKDATDMTRVMQMDMVKTQLQSAAANARGPMEKARILQEMGKLDQAAAPILSQMAMRKTLLTGMKDGRTPPEQVVRMIVPENHQQAAYKELGDAQEYVKNRDNVLSAFDRLAQINTLGNRATNPLQSKKEIKAILGATIPALSKATAGRYTEADAKVTEDIFNTLGSSKEVTAQQRARLVNMLAEKGHYPMLKAYNIDVNNMGRFGAQGQSRIQESAPVIKK